MKTDYQTTGSKAQALFTLKLHRGDGMTLLAMNWKKGRPPREFVGFAIEYREPDGDRFFALKNRLAFSADGEVNPARLSTRLSPIQKFRWVHFPRFAEKDGNFVYRVTPVFMNGADELSYGEFQEAEIQLRRETVPGLLNVTFTRGFVSSQAFVDKYGADAVPQLLPGKAKDGLDFTPTHPLAAEALEWMGFEARSAILEVLDEAIADPEATVQVVAYDLSEPEVVSRLKKLKKRLRILIDDAGEHAHDDSGESQAAALLAKSAGAQNVRRQHLGSLQHNKTIVVDGPNVKAVVCGSTNYSWRGFYVQANNAVILRGAKPVALFAQAFENYWASDSAADFGQSGSADWQNLSLKGVNAQVTFSPHSEDNARLNEVADDIGSAQTCLFYSLAFLYQTDGPIRDAIETLTNRDDIFVYGISDRKVGGLIVQKPDGNLAPVAPKALAKNVPEPFKSEPEGGGGNRMHHKFLVVDFNTPDARVYLGSYNFSNPADRKNGENLLLIRDRRIVTSYMIEAVRIFDHYHFRLAQAEAKKKRTKLHLARPPREAGEKAWWEEYYDQPRKLRDRELFA